MAEFAMMFTSFWGMVFFGGVFLVLMLYAVDHEMWVASTFVLVITALMLQFFTDYKVFTYLVNNPLTVLMWAGVYVAAGVIWSMVKWALYALGVKERFNEYCVSELNDINLHNSGIIDGNVRVERRPVPTKEVLLANYNKYKIEKLPLDVKKYKSKITFWMIWWPWSALWTLLNDPIRRFYNMLYNMFGGVFQKISDKIIGV